MYFLTFIFWQQSKDGKETNTFLIPTAGGEMRRVEAGLWSCASCICSTLCLVICARWCKLISVKVTPGCTDWIPNVQYIMTLDRQTQHTVYTLTSLTLSIPSNSEWVTSPSPSITGAKRSKVGVGQEKPNKNAHISTVNTAVLPSVSRARFHSPPPPFIQNQTPIHHPSTSGLLSSSMKRLYPILNKTSISLTSHRIFANLNINITQQEVTEFSPFIGKQFILKLVSVCLCFSRQQSRVCGASFRKQREHTYEKRGPHSMVQNVSLLRSG